MKKVLSTLAVGIALFAMFFGGGNLTFPLWIGITNTSQLPATLGFLLSGVMLPFYGLMIGLYFKGDYRKVLGCWGKPICSFLVFFLLLLWIPLGSGPRCHQISHGAFHQMGWDTPLWIYSAIYGVLVYVCTYKKKLILDILGDFITPILLAALIALFYTGVKGAGLGTSAHPINWKEFFPSFRTGFFTMDFIAAIFFASSVIELLKEKHKEAFSMTFVKRAFMVGIACLSFVYLSMIIVGHVHADWLVGVPREQLLPLVARIVFQERFSFWMFLIITLSCLTTSIALSLVFSEYLRKHIFKGKIAHGGCLAISIFLSYLVSILGFERLAIFIGYAMNILYPLLFVSATASLIQSIYKRKRGLELLFDE